MIEWVLEVFGIEYSISGMRDLLHRLGFVYKHCRAVPSRADEQTPADFLDNELPGMLVEAREGKAVVYSADVAIPPIIQRPGEVGSKRGEILKWIAMVVVRSSY